MSDLVDKKTGSVKRIYFRSLRKVWRHERWIANLSRYSPDWDRAHKNRTYWEEMASYAKEELKRRGWWTS